MAFTKKFRTDFPATLQKRFRCYWHVMHPVDFDPDEIYRIGWTDETWDAFQLLLERRSEVIKDGFMWSYDWDWTGQNIPDYVPEEASLNWQTKDGYPSIELQEKELSPGFQAQMREWIFEAYRYRELGNTLFSQVQRLVRVNYESINHGYHATTKETSICNTPATLLAVWPELIPYIPSEERDVMRHRHMRPSPPRIWTEEDQLEFDAVPGMGELNHALQTMSLIPDKIDKDYPSLTD